jgi:hypothetical protein
MSARDTIDSMSFREKSALVTLVVLLITALGYAGLALRYPPPHVAVVAVSLVGAMILFTGIMILSQISLVIAVGFREASRPSDERDRMVMLASRRNAGWVGVMGLWLILGLAVTSAPHLIIAYAAIGLFVLAELVLYGSELVYYRRGV